MNYSSPVPAVLMQPQTMMQPPPCLTVIMEEWNRMPATTSAALVNSMPRRIKAVLDNNGPPTKY